MEDEAASQPEEQQKPEVIASLDVLMAKVSEKQAKPPTKYVDEETGVTFYLRELTGVDVEQVASLAGQDESKYMYQLVARAAVNPKVDRLMWEALGKLGPMVRGGLALKVRQISGMLEENIDYVKNA